MPTVEMNVLNAFTIEGSGGNPAGVIFDADSLSTTEKQVIAAKAGLSETAFVSASQDAAFRLDFFTPVRQIAHCGHATIATFSYLKQTGKIAGNASSKMTIEGRREIKFVGDEAYMEQHSPRFVYFNQDDNDAVLASLGLSREDVILPAPVIVNTGNSFALIEVVNKERLASLVPHFDAIARISEKHGLIGYYVFCKTPGSNMDATTRMFAPAYGIKEEAATGLAAGPLACYLYQFGEQKEHYRIEQGRYMRPSSASLLKIELTVRNEEITSLYVGGTATLINKQIIQF